MTDATNPDHYRQGEIECIEAIEAMLGRDGYVAFLRGQVVKYQWRMMHKGATADDAAKSAWYAQRLAALFRDAA